MMIEKDIKHLKIILYLCMLLLLFHKQKITLHLMYFGVRYKYSF